MKLNKIATKNACLIAWKLFAAVNLLITTALIFLPDIIDYIRIRPFYCRIAIMFVLLLLLFIISFYIATRKKKIIINIGQTKITVLTGKMFDDGQPCYEGYNIITVSELFYSTPGVYVSSNTTHSEFLHQIVKNDVKEVANKINSSLSRVAPKNQSDVPRRYPLGTTAVIKYGQIKYIFLAIVEKDEEYQCIPTSIPDFQKILAELWRVIRLQNEGFSVNMTLIGSGRSGVNLTPYHILQTILMSLHYESQRNVVVNKLRIIVDEEKMKSIDLDRIKSYWDAALEKSNLDT